MVTSTRKIELERQYSKLWNRAMINGAQLSSALDVVSVSGPIEQRLVEDHVKGKTALYQVLSKLKMPSVSLEEIAEAIASQAVVDTRSVVSAACIVLGHSVVDDFINTAASIDIECSPEEWLSEIDLRNKKVTLSAVKEKGFSGLMSEELQRYATSFGKKSLPSKAEIFFRHVPISQHKDIPKTEPAYFRMSTLKKIDEVRHEFVHGNGIAKLKGTDLLETRSRVEFLTEAAMVILRSLGIKQKLDIDKTLMFAPSPKDKVDSPVD